MLSLCVLDPIHNAQRCGIVFKGDATFRKYETRGNNNYDIESITIKHCYVNLMQVRFDFT